MAANRVGALYYEAILDPRGFSRGVLKVRNDQAVLAAAIKDTSDPLDKLRAELQTLDRVYEEIAAKDPFEGQQESLDALVKKTMMLSDELEEMQAAPQREAEASAEADRQKEADAEAARQEDLKKRYLAIAKSRKERLAELGRKRQEEHAAELQRIESEKQALEKSQQAELDRQQQIQDRYLAIARARQQRLEEERRAKEKADKEDQERAEKAAKDEEARQKTIQQRWLAVAKSRKERLEREEREKEAAKKAELDRQQERQDRWMALAKSRNERLAQEKKEKEDAEKAAQKKAEETAKAEKKAAKEAEAHERRMKTLQTERMAKRLSNAVQYMTSFKGMKILFADLTKSVSGVTGGLSKMAGNLAQAAGMGPQVQGLARAFGALGLRVLGVVAAIYAIGKALKSAALAADEFEQRQIKIIASMQGNELRAKALTERMREYAARTSYSTAQMQDFAAKLLALGVVASDIPDLAEKLGGLAMGDSEKLKRIAKAYSDVQAKGRLMAQEANQFAEALVPLERALLANGVAKSRVELRAMMEQGKISAKMVDEALEKAAEMVGAEKAMELRQDTIAGQWDEIKSSLSEIWRIIGGPVQNSIVTILQLVNWFVKKIESVAKAFEPFTEDLNFAAGKFYNMFVIAKKLYYWISGQADKLKEQAETEGKIADEKAKREKQELEELDRQEKRQENYDKMLQSLTDELQSYYDRFNNEEKLAEMQFERMLAEKLALDEIDAKQAEMLRRQYKFVEAEKERLDLEKQRADEAKKAAEDEKKEQLKIDKEYRAELDRIDKEEAKRDEQLHQEAKEREAQIEKQIKDKMGVAKEADAGAGVSFEAGSVEEFNMLRQMEMQARRDAQQVIFEQEAAKERKESNRILSQMLLNMQSDAQKEREDAQWNYYGN
jgi:tape measure domain-containing protein